MTSAVGARTLAVAFADSSEATGVRVATRPGRRAAPRRDRARSVQLGPSAGIDQFIDDAFEGADCDRQMSLSGKQPSG
jgi:hypothetical protein